MRFTFGEFELDADRFELRRGDAVVAVQPKVLELILYLVRHGDRAVAVDELMRAIWPDARVTKSSLARAVSLARRVLDGEAGSTSMIATVKRRGYRFRAPVAFVDALPDRSDPGFDYVGRRTLLVRAEGMLRSASAGHGRIVLLVGEAGVGKTRTAELLAIRARAQGAQVATVWGIASSAPALWGWQRVLAQLLEASPGLLDGLAPGHRVALSRLLTTEASTTAPDDARGMETPFGDAAVRNSLRVKLFDAVSACLGELARHRPLLLVFDDLHAADAETMGLLEMIGRSIASYPIAVIATAREEEATMTAQQAREFGRLLRLGAVERWPLVGLHDDELTEFVARRMGRDPEPSLRSVLERKTGGNPLLLGESLGSLVARGLLEGERSQSEWESLLPKGIDHLLRPKLRELSGSAVELLGLAAGFGMEIDRCTLARASGSSAPFEESMQELVEQGLLRADPTPDRVHFPHALVRDAVYALLVPNGPGRRRVHARIFAALDPASNPDAMRSEVSERELANHACEAVPSISAERAATLARAAGQQSVELFDFAGAADWYARALDVLARAEAPPIDLDALLRLELAQARARSEGLERARAAFLAAASAARRGGRRDLFARAALGLAARPNSTGREDPEVVALLEEVLEDEASGRSALGIRAASRLAAEIRYSQHERSDALAERSLAAAHRLGDPAILAETLEDATFMRWSPADPTSWIDLNVEVARHALLAGDTDLAISGHKGCFSGHLEIGDHVAVERAIRACEEVAKAVPTAFARWWCLVLRASQALIGGDLELAEQRIVGSLAVADQIDSPEIAIELKAQICYLRIEQGRAGEIEEVAREQLRLFPSQPSWRAGYARILIGEGRLTEARDVLAPLIDDGFRGIPIDRGWMGTHALSSEVVAAIGDVAAARILEERLRPFADRTVVIGSAVYYGPISHFLGVLATVQGRYEEAFDDFESAIAAAQRAGARLLLARTRVELCRALLARGAENDRVRAARLIQDAIGVAERRGFAAVLADARALEAAVWSRGARRGAGGAAGTRSKRRTGES